MGWASSRKLSWASALRSLPTMSRSVWRRMMLWSESWKTSTRLRPRSLAALQAISGAAPGGGERRGEPVPGDARRQGRRHNAAGHALGHARDHIVADVHAESLV